MQKLENKSSATKKRLVPYPKSPSHYMSLKLLKQLLKDNCIAASGQEYNEEEVKELIMYKLQRDSERIIKRVNIHQVKLVYAWERIDGWRKQIAKLQVKIRKERKKYGI
jgi:hypothetical protein